ncbi:MAG: hypothetical protein LBM60_02160 [Clostridium sp.]|jgi:hypothetical protein|nr:hypothetical protein [Clostridium sp.]
MTRNRFAKRSGDSFWWRDILFPVLMVLLFLYLLNVGLGALGTRSEMERRESAKNAITRAAVQCYALEGRYPQSISYLEEKYGLRVDRDNYTIHYQAFAPNILPDIDVIPLDVSPIADTPPKDDGSAEDDWIIEDDWEPEV